MKNDDEMYQRVLSRRNEYREQKKKRTRTIKRITPVIACFFFTIVIGFGYRDSFSKLLKVPTQPNVIEESPIVVTDTTEPANESPESTKPSATESKSTDNSAAVSTMVIVSGTETMQTASPQQHQSQTVATHASVSGTQIPVTTAPVADTKPITEVQTTSPVQTTVEAPKTIVTETKQINHVTSSGQSIAFHNMTAVVNSIKNYGQNGGNDGSDAQFYYEESLMFERFINDGYIYQVNSNDSITLRADLSIYLFPYATYEDIGIGYYVTYEGNLYHVIFYYADRDLINATDGITQYLQKRTGRSSNKEIVIRDQTVSILFSNNGQTCASSFVDQTHYYDVVTAASEEELTEFLNLFSYKKILL